MTDDKGACEGPYVACSTDDGFGVADSRNKVILSAEVVSFRKFEDAANFAFAEGVKAEREKLCESIISNIGRSMEALASIEHDRWARWHIYAKNNWTPENIIRWDRQAETKYQDLTEEEKEKDRQEVRNYLWVIKNAIISVEGEK